MGIEELVTAAASARKSGVGSRLEVCGIVNAKSGKCGENCRFCAQSAHYNTGIVEYPLKSADELVLAASQAKENGASKFGIVTSGNKLTPEELAIIASAVERIVKDIGITACASLGALDKDSFVMLKKAGLARYHHNIETSRRYYPSIVSTHNHDDRVATIKAAVECGLEICSGGIIGMGETWGDRLDMALELEELGVDCVPLNFLIPIKGTPLGEFEQVSAADAIRTIAMFRLVLKDKDIKIIAGRETVLKDFQAMMYMAGANGMMVGGYLTTGGRAVSDDKALVKEVQALWNV